MKAPVKSKIFWEYASDLNEVLDRWLESKLNLTVLSTDQTAYQRKDGRTMIIYTILYSTKQLGDL